MYIEDPIYPDDARAHGLSGLVILEIIIDENGSVVDPRVLRSDNYIFNASAVSAVQKWRYKPAIKDGRAVRVFKSITIPYRLH